MKRIILLTLLTVFSSVSFAQSNVPTPSTGNATLDNAMNQAKNQSGSYNSMAANPFSFCGTGRPGKHNPMRVVWDQVCPDGKKQAAPSPVPVPSGPNLTLPNTQNLQNQFNQSNQSSQNTSIINTPPVQSQLNQSSQSPVSQAPNSYVR